MKKDELRTKMILVFKYVATTLLLTLGVTILTEVVGSLYDHRIILGVIAGALGYDKLFKLLSKVKGLK